MNQSKYCTEEKHYNCGFLSSFTCNCSCHKHSLADYIEKSIAATAGLLTIIAGLATTLSSFGIAATAGGALIGGGISSAMLALEKAITNERLELNEYAAEVGFGAATGAATNGIISLSEQMANQGLKKLVYRAGAGALSGLIAKSLDEAKQITTNSKPFSEFGQVVTDDGYVDITSTLTEWTAGLGIGAIGGACRHLNSNVAKTTTSAQSRLAMSSATAALNDLTQQGMNITAGKQQGYNPHQTLTTVAKSMARNSLLETGKKIIESSD